jgi:S-adenosyl-L-methionine hydrolase (adenosine-forming)
MPLRYDTISFLSDYGLDDEFVGIVRSVVRSIAADVAVIDVTHAIAPHDVRAAGLALARSASYLCPGVVLGIVDPGVGTRRRAVAIEVGDGISVLVGPDNGLFAPAVAMVGGATAAYELTNTDYHLPAPGATFAGRDIFAPVAAHLCLGVPLDELGTEIDPHTLTPGVFPLSRYDEGALVCEALWIDRFGNVQLNIAADDLDPFGPRVRVVVNGRPRVGVRAEAYGDVRVGELGLVVDSYGLVSLCVDRGSAALELAVHAGAQVILEAFDADVDRPEGVPIRLQPRSGGAR